MVEFSFVSLIIILIIAIPYYLIGSIPFGLIITKVFLKKDIRTTGSGNIGATNVLRNGGKILAIITLFLDLGKGAFAAFFAYAAYESMGTLGDPDYEMVKSLKWAAIAVIGHCFPVWLKFKGGKGVATTLGVLLAAVPWVGLAACGVWLITAFAFKISSLAALIAIGIAPIVTFFIYGGAPAIVTLLIAALVFWRHRANITRLLKGIEPKIGQK
ncbi:MAG: glycerol-3-phosphate 1-O-acyltransferase PlsY [Bdellovibrionales bacterium]